MLQGSGIFYCFKQQWTVRMMKDKQATCNILCLII